jgi:ATP-binding cassette subfamily B (MDR/TAP) protein 1
MNLPEWRFLMGGAFSSIVQGSIQTIDGILFGILISEWGNEDANISMSATNKEGLKFLLLAFVAGFTAYSKGICFSKSGEELTYRLRTLAFESMINQDVDWFDKKNNHLGALSARLSGDAALVQGVLNMKDTI